MTKATKAAYPGWLPLMEAATKHRIRYELLRRLVHADVFTTGRFGPAKKCPRIYVRAEEIKAWKAGGEDAVRAVRAAKPQGEVPCLP